MPADRPRAWQYMGAEPVDAGHDQFVRGDIYIARHPWTPDDIPLAPPVEVTPGMVLEADEAAHADPRDLTFSERFAAAMNLIITERLAARQEGE